MCFDCWVLQIQTRSTHRIWIMHLSHLLIYHSLPLAVFPHTPPPPHKSVEETGSLLWLSATCWIQLTASSWCGLKCSAVPSISCRLMMMEPETWSDPASEYNFEVCCCINQGTCKSGCLSFCNFKLDSWVWLLSIRSSLHEVPHQPFPWLFLQLPMHVASMCDFIRGHTVTIF